MTEFIEKGELGEVVIPAPPGVERLFAFVRGLQFEEVNLMLVASKGPELVNIIKLVDALPADKDLIEVLCQARVHDDDTQMLGCELFFAEEQVFPGKIGVRLEAQRTVNDFRKPDKHRIRIDETLVRLDAEEDHSYLTIKITRSQNLVRGWLPVGRHKTLAHLTARVGEVEDSAIFSKTRWGWDVVASAFKNGTGIIGGR